MRGVKVAMSICLAFVLACSSAPKGQQQSDKLNSAVTKLGDSFNKAESNLRVTMEAYTNLLNAEGDLKQPYKAFESALKTGEKMLTDMTTNLIDANAAAANYFQTYENNLESITDEGVREQSRARLETRRSAYTAFQTHLQAGLDNYKPILEKLRAHAQALGLELTPASVAAIKSQSGEAEKLAEDWYKRDEEIKKDVEKFLTENAPTAGG